MYSKINSTKNINNIHFIAKIKPTQNNNPDYLITDENKIEIKDQGNKIFFKYDNIYDIKDNTLNIFNDYYNLIFSKLLENINVSVLSLGGKSSGKTYNIFNNYNIDKNKGNEGLIFKVYKKIYKSIEKHQNLDNFETKLSMILINDDRIQDLLKKENNNNMKNSIANNININLNNNAFIGINDSLNLEIIEKNNGQVGIKNLNNMTIKDVKSLAHYIEAGLRESYLYSNSNPNEYYNIITTLTFSLKDKENFNFPSINSSIQFIEISNSNIFDDIKATAANNKINTNFDFFILKKMISNIYHKKKNNDNKYTKFTKIVQNCLSSNSQILIISNFFPEKEFIQKNIEQIIHCQKMIELEKKGEYKAESYSKKPVNIDVDIEEEKLINSLKDDIKQLQTTINYLHSEQRDYFRNIGNIIELEEKVETMIYKPNAMFWKDFKDKKSYIAKNKVLLSKHVELQKSYEILNNEFYSIRDNFYADQEKFISHIFNLNDEIKYLNDVIKIESSIGVQLDNEFIIKKNNFNTKIIDANRKLVTEKNKNINKIDVNSYKNNNIYYNNNNFSDKIGNNTAKEIEDSVVNSLEYKLKKDLESNKINNNSIYLSKKENYKIILENKVKEYDTIYNKCTLKSKKIRSKIKSIESEMLYLYDIINKQFKVINKIGKLDKTDNYLYIPLDIRKNIKNIDSKLFSLLYKYIENNNLKEFINIKKLTSFHKSLQIDIINDDITKINYDNLNNVKDLLSNHVKDIKDNIKDINEKTKKINSEKYYINEIEDMLIEINNYKKLIEIENKNNNLNTIVN